MSDRLTHSGQRDYAQSIYESVAESGRDKYLYAIIRKPQEGKTFICLKSIQKSPDSIHIIVTMNTIKSNLQFFQRANTLLNGNICVLNSKGKKKESQEYNHSKDVSGVRKFIFSGINHIIMCAHPKRFDESIIQLLEILEDSKKFNKNVTIHIDEAHEYVPPHRSRIIEMNDFDIVDRIYMYSATPFKIWDSYGAKLFQNIWVVDVKEQFGIMKSADYFGVKDCVIKITNDCLERKHSEYISTAAIMESGTSSTKEALEANPDIKFTWLTEGETYFSLGDEYKYLNYVRHTLENLRDGGDISNESFSYNFIPAYIRKVTHYGIMENILDVFPRAVVVVINGDGTKQWRLGKKGLKGKVLPHDNEPSKQIQKVIRKHPDQPIFITGFHCVSMSVTLISEKIGNFHNVILSHDQFINHPETLYQLCRFLFNYTSWGDKSHIRKTIIHSNNMECIQSCLNYEKQIDKIEETMCGSLRTQEEICGDVRVKPSQKINPTRRLIKVC